MIDLHTHTTASDGRCSPDELVARAAGAGVDVLSVTDHDTTAAAAAVAAACEQAGIEFVPGIEVTAVHEGVDVHVLGYFLDPNAAGLSEFLARQRKRRADRIRQMIARLAALGIPLDADAILRPSESGEGKAAGQKGAEPKAAAPAAHGKKAKGTAAAPEKPGAVAETTADAQGELSFSGIAAGKYVVVARQKGVGAGREQVTVSNDAPGNRCGSACTSTSRRSPSAGSSGG